MSQQESRARKPDRRRNFTPKKYYPTQFLHISKPNTGIEILPVSCRMSQQESWARKPGHSRNGALDCERQPAISKK
jgi:hypothetical protein